jgi:hypothetical protein
MFQDAMCARQALCEGGEYRLLFKAHPLQVRMWSQDDAVCALAHELRKWSAEAKVWCWPFYAVTIG